MNEVILNNIEFTRAENAIIDAFKNAIDSGNISDLKGLYKLYGDNKALMFKMFQGGSNGTSILNIDQQKVLFDSLEWKQKSALYNTIDSNARAKYYNSLSKSEATKFKNNLRQQGVNNAIRQEIELLDEGYCTRNWDTEQLKEMYQFKNNGTELKADPGTPHEFDAFGDVEYTFSVQGPDTKNPGKVNIKETAVAGHHMMAVQDYPEYMADGKVIQFLSSEAHYDAHGGNYKNATLAYFDGENYIGLQYKEPYINEFGEYIEGEFLGDGKMYKLVNDNGKLGHFEEIAIDPDAYNDLLGKKFPPRKISTEFPSVKEASYILGGKNIEKYTAEELFNARIGIAEYRNLGIDIESAHDPKIAEYLKNVGEDPSVLSKTSITLNEEGKITEVILKLDNSADEIKIVTSDADTSASKYTVNASEYKKMTVLPDDIAEESIGLRYHGSKFDELTPIEKLKLRKADAVFAEKGLYLSLDDLDASAREGLASVYEDKVAGKMPEDMAFTLLDKYQTEKKSLQAEYDELQKRSDMAKQDEADVDEYIRRLKSYAGANELTRQMAIDLIEYITLDNNPRKKAIPRDIHIYYKLIDRSLNDKRNALA